MRQDSAELWRWILSLAVIGGSLFVSGGLILLFQLARSGNIDPPTSEWTLLAIAASAVVLAALGPAIAAWVVHRRGFYWLSAVAGGLTALFILVLVVATG